MNRPSRKSAAASALCLLALSGCALLSKGKPLQLRFFDLDTRTDYQPERPEHPARLRLGEVSAARHIDRRFMTREGAHELSYRDAWRWTEPPDAYLERALSRDLYERAGLTRVLSGVALTLEVELTAFEELTTNGAHRAHATALAMLHDDREQLWQRHFSVEAEVKGGDQPAALAEALGRALGKIADDITAQTLSALPSAAPASPEAPGRSEHAPVSALFPNRTSGASALR